MTGGQISLYTETKEEEEEEKEETREEEEGEDEDEGTGLGLTRMTQNINTIRRTHRDRRICRRVGVEREEMIGEEEEEEEVGMMCSDKLKEDSPKP